jgi:hypothetical protein
VSSSGASKKHFWAFAQKLADPKIQLLVFQLHTRPYLGKLPKNEGTDVAHALSVPRPDSSGRLVFAGKEDAGTAR